MDVKVSSRPDIARHVVLRPRNSKGFEFCNGCSEINSCEQMQKFVQATTWLYQQGVLKNMEENLA